MLPVGYSDIKGTGWNIKLSITAWKLNVKRRPLSNSNENIDKRRSQRSLV